MRAVSCSLECLDKDATRYSLRAGIRLTRPEMPPTQITEAQKLAREWQ